MPGEDPSNTPRSDVREEYREAEERICSSEILSAGIRMRMGPGRENGFILSLIQHVLLGTCCVHAEF